MRRRIREEGEEGGEEEEEEEQLTTSRAAGNLTYERNTQAESLLRLASLTQNTMPAAMHVFSLALSFKNLTENTHNDIMKPLPMCTVATTVKAMYQILRYTVSVCGVNRSFRLF